MWETWVRSLGWEDPPEKGKATYSSILAWRIPWTVESMRSQRVGHDWVAFTVILLLFSHLGLAQNLWTIPHFIQNSVSFFVTNEIIYDALESFFLFSYYSIKISNLWPTGRGPALLVPSSPPVEQENKHGYHTCPWEDGDCKALQVLSKVTCEHRMNHCPGAAVGEGHDVCGLGQMPFYSETTTAKPYTHPETIYG